MSDKLPYFQSLMALGRMRLRTGMIGCLTFMLVVRFHSPDDSTSVVYLGRDVSSVQMVRQ